MKNKLYTTLKRGITSLTFIAILTIWSFSLKGQDMPIIVNFTIPPPYTPFITDYENKIDEIIFNINNTSNSSHSLYFHASLERIEGGRVFTNPSYRPAMPFNIGPFESQSLTAGDIVGLNQAFRGSNLRSEGIDVDEVIARGILPEGTYRICITAFDFNTDQLRSIPGTGCSNPFVITHTNPPRLNTPANEFAFCDPNGVLQFQWTPVMGLAGSQIEYDIEFIDLTALGMSTDDPLAPFVDGATRFYTVENLMTPFYQYFIGMSDLPFEAGHHYAWRVRARDVNEVVFIRDDGYSEVFTFHYNCEDIDPNDFKIKVVFPKNKDSIPYQFPYLAIEFEPFSERYTRMEWDLIVRRKSDGQVVHTKSDAIAFGDGGPLARIRRHLPQAGKKRAATHPLANVSDFPKLKKGEIYQWTATVRLIHPEGNLSRTMINNEFFYGMRKPKAESPTKGEKVAPGNVNFRFHTGKKPSRIAPDSAMIHMPGIFPDPTFHRIESLVSEAFLLEVYPSREAVDDLSKRIYTYRGNFSGSIPPYDPIDKEAIEESLFKMMSHESTTAFQNIILEGEEGPFLDTFYWQIVYLDDPLNESKGRYQKSKLSYFIVDSSISSEDSGDSEDECGNDCEAPEITDRTTRKSIAVNEEIRVGKFTMKVKEITGSSNNAYNGKGTIRIPFFANINLLVEFRNMVVNNAGQFYSGTVEAIDDPIGLNFQELATGFGTLRQLEEGAGRDAFETALATGGRLLSSIATGTEIGLPVGLDTDIGGSKFIVGIVGAEFEPREANVQVMMYLSVPEAEAEGFEVPGFGAQLCINPNGFGPDKLMYMVGNLGIPFGGEEDFVLRFKGASPEGGDPDTNKISYIQLDCNGFKAAQIALEVEFPRSMIVPENPDGSIKEEGRVKGFSRFKVTGSGGWLAQFTMDKFQIAGLENWSFHVNDAYLDFSDTENPPGFKFPKHYGNTTLSGSSDPAVRSRWQGFYLKNLTVYTPRGLTDDDENYRFHFGVKDMLIDNTGFSANIFAANIAQYKEKNPDNMEPKISGWALSLDTVSIVFSSNNFISGGISGKIGLPITEKTQYLKYKLAMEYDPSKDEFKFKGNVKPDGTLTIPMVIAELQLEQSSQLYFEIGSKSKAGVKLTGNLNMSKDFAGALADVPGDFEMAGLRFENLEIDTKDGFKGGTLADRSMDGLGLMGASGSGGGSSRENRSRSVGGFPLSISSINFSANGFNPVLSIEPKLSFSSDGEGLALETTLNFEFKYENNSFDLEKLSVSSITLDIDFSALKLKGRIEFYNRPHGDGIVEGFKGELEVRLPMEIEAKLAAEFGVFKVPETTMGFGSREFFGYFSLDAEVRGLKVTLMPAIQLTGLAGGFYHRMRQENASALSSGASIMGGSGSGPSGANYVIDYDIVFGMNFKAMFCFPDKCDLYSLDAGFGISFREGGELGNINILGELYVMTDRSKNEIPKVYAGVQLDFNNPPNGASEFNGQFAISIAVGPQGNPFLRGNNPDCPPPPFPRLEFPCYLAVDAHLFIPSVNTSERWFFHMGKPSPESARGGLILSFLGNPLIEFKNYLMIGNEIPINLPPLPHNIETLLDRNQTLDARNQSEMMAMRNNRVTSAATRANAQTGSGFAFGASLAVNVRLDIAIFYFALDFILGFDINMTKSTVWCYGPDGSDPFMRGKNGWYAQGQVYAYLMADLGIQVNLLFIRGEFSILKGEVAMALQGRLPNPEYFLGRAAFRYEALGGMITGQCNFRAEFGEKCEVLGGNPFGDVPFIGDIKPEGNNSNNGYSVFSNADIAFNWPINTILPFPKDPDDPEAGVRYIYVSPEYARIRNTSNGRIVASRMVYSNENYSLTLEPYNWLEGHINHTTEIRLRGRERGLSSSMNPAHWGSIRYPNPVDTNQLITWVEEEAKTFWTGPRPTVIAEENVHHTYPLNRQRYFLKGEGQPYLRQTRATHELFANPFEGEDVRYIVRYRPVHGGDDIEVPFRAWGVFLQVEQPNLENNTLYQVDFIREPDLPPYAYTFEMIGREVLNNPQFGLPTNMRLSLATTFDLRNLAHGSGDAKVEKRKITAASIREDKQTILYTYHFKTSRYNTLAQKLWPVNFNTTGHFFHMGVALLSRENLVEPFEAYDLVGYSKGNKLRVPPLVQFVKPPIFTSYHSRVNMDYTTYRDYYNFATNINLSFWGASRNQLRSVARGRLARNEAVFRNNGISPYRGTTVSPIQRNMARPLTDHEASGGPSWFIYWFTPDERLSISYQEAALVFNQTNVMKRKIQSLLNYQAGFQLPFAIQLAGDRPLNNRVNTFLNRPGSFYALNTGWYYFRAEYTRPNPLIPTERIEANEIPLKGSSRTWSFSHNR